LGAIFITSLFRAYNLDMTDIEHVGGQSFDIPDEASYAIDWDDQARNCLELFNRTGNPNYIVKEAQAKAASALLSSAIYGEPEY
jgi:hypothetical protein